MPDQLLEIKEMITSRTGSEQRTPDKHTRRLLLYLFTSTRGGPTRLRMIGHLLDRPYNTHQLAQAMSLDYKAIQHHLGVLEKNNLVVRMGDRYGAIFYVSSLLELNISALSEAIDILDRKLSRRKIYI